MDKFIDTIRLAVAEDAPTEAKQAGAQACRAILTALEAEPGKALAATPAPLASPLAGADIGQVLDLLIAKLRTMVPAEQTGRSPAPLTIPVIQVPNVR